MAKQPAPFTDPARSSLGERVRQLRRRRGLTLRETADRLGVSAATLSAIENGRTGLTVARLELLAEVLRAPVTSLLSGDGQDGASGSVAAEVATNVPATDEGPQYGGGAWRLYPALDLGPVLTAALESILDTGYHGASIRDVARRAGMSVPGLYHHYASKQDMLAAVLDFTMRDVLARSKAALAEGETAGDRFCLLVECLTLYHSHRRELAFVGSSELRRLEPGNRTYIVAMRNQVQSLVDEQVDAAVKDGTFRANSPHLAARAVVTMCTAVAAWYRAGGPVPPEELAEQYVGFAIDVMRHEGAESGRAQG